MVGRNHRFLLGWAYFEGLCPLSFREAYTNKGTFFPRFAVATSAKSSQLPSKVWPGMCWWEFGSAIAWGCGTPGCQDAFENHQDASYLFVGRGFQPKPSFVTGILGGLSPTQAISPPKTSAELGVETASQQLYRTYIIPYSHTEIPVVWVYCKFSKRISLDTPLDPQFGGTPKIWINSQNSSAACDCAAAVAWKCCELSSWCAWVVLFQRHVMGLMASWLVSLPTFNPFLNNTKMKWRNGKITTPNVYFTLEGLKVFLSCI